MTIYRSILRIGEFPRFDDSFVVHTKRRPMWSQIREAIEDSLVQIEEKMGEDGRTDYDHLASRRAELRRLKQICPARAVLANPDDLGVGAGRLVISEIKVL